MNFKSPYHKVVFTGFVVLLLGMSSCRKNEIEPKPNDLGYAYFPNKVGNTWVYRVDSIVYDAFVKGGKIDTFSYWVKHVIDGEFKDATGVVNQKVSLYIKTDSTTPYVFNRNFSMRVADYRAEVTDSAGKYIKLVFPPALFQYWDGNLFNAQKEEEYQIIQKQNRQLLNGVLYDSTLEVLHRDVEYFIQKRYGAETYAKHFGMIFKNVVHWDIEMQDTVRVKDGFEYTYKLESFIP